MSSQLMKSIEKATGSTTARTLSNSNINILKKQMTLFEKTKELPRNLHLLQQALLTIPLTSVEAERCFSAAGPTVSKLRNRSSDEMVDRLSFL